MTIIEAENQYDVEVANCIVQHKKRLQKLRFVCIIISFVLILLGIVLVSIAYNTPPEIDSFGYEWESSEAMLKKMFGTILLCWGAIPLLLIIPWSFFAQKKGPVSFLPQIKNLYFNYLKCEDMNKDDKEFYKQKLEDIRNAELVNAIHRASTAASAAIMFSALKK